MITTAFIYLAGLVINGVLVLMTPLGNSNGFSADVDAAVTGAATYIGRANTFVDLAAVQTVILFIITFEITIMTFYLIRWLFGYVPVVGGR